MELPVYILLQLDEYLLLARCDSVPIERALSDAPDFVAETNGSRYLNDHILSIFSNIDADLQCHTPSSPALFFNLEVLYLSPPTSPTMFPYKPASPNEHSNLAITSTMKPSDNTARLRIFQQKAFNSSQLTLMRNRKSFHPPIFFQLSVDPFYHVPITSNIALMKLQIFLSGTNIAECSLLLNQEQLANQGSTPDLNMAS